VYCSLSLWFSFPCRMVDLEMFTSNPTHTFTHTHNFQYNSDVSFLPAQFDFPFALLKSLSKENNITHKYIAQQEREKSSSRKKERRVFFCVFDKYFLLQDFTAHWTSKRLSNVHRYFTICSCCSDGSLGCGTSTQPFHDTIWMIHV